MARDARDNMKIWTESLITTLDPDEVERIHKTLFTTANKLKRQFNQLKLTKPEGLATEFAESLDKFRRHLPVIRHINSDGLMHGGSRRKHLDKIENLCLDGAEINGGSNNTIGLSFKDAYKTVNLLEEIADTASKEYANERNLAGMKSDWEPIQFATKEFRGTGILTGEAVELLQQSLDDHLIKTQTMKGSPYIGDIKDETFEWE